MPRPVHFEIALRNPDNTTKFYETVFGWKISKWGGTPEYWLCSTGDGEQGIDGGFARSDKPSNGAILSITVDNIDSILETILGAGGEILRPKTPIPGVGYVAYFADPEGMPWAVFEEIGNPE